jgi:hypothetical protein
MAKLLALYHSQQHRHVKTMAKALAKGARGVDTDVTVFNTNHGMLVEPGSLLKCNIVESDGEPDEIVRNACLDLGRKLAESVH